MSTAAAVPPPFLLSVVICTHNRAAYLVKALDSLVVQTLPRDRFEVIVVDNRSTDDTRAVAGRYAGSLAARYVYEEQLGLSYARNAGWRSARGRYIAYLDDDAIATPRWAEKIVEAFETVTPTPGCVGGPAEGIWEAPRPAWLSDALVTCLTVIDWTETPHAIEDLRVQWLVGANIAIRADVLARVGGFHVTLDRAGKNLLSGGDVFLQELVVQAGYSCYYHPEIAVGHHVPASRLDQRWFLRRYYWQGVSDAAMRLTREDLPAVRRLRKVGWLATRLLKSPRNVALLLTPTAEPDAFARKCFALITVGHIAGLLGAARR